MQKFSTISGVTGFTYLKALKQLKLLTNLSLCLSFYMSVTYIGLANASYSQPLTEVQKAQIIQDQEFQSILNQTTGKTNQSVNYSNAFTNQTPSSTNQVFYKLDGQNNLNKSNVTNSNIVSTTKTEVPRKVALNSDAEGFDFLNAPAVIVKSAEQIGQNSSKLVSNIVNDMEQSVSKTWYKMSHSVDGLISNALSLIGVKYKYGGNTPSTGLDCSGFVRYVFKETTGIQLPRTSNAMSQAGSSINKSEIQAGDLVFFNTRGASYSHVGIYLGDNKFVHAPSSGAFIRTDDMTKNYWASRYNGARRIL